MDGFIVPNNYPILVLFTLCTFACGKYSRWYAIAIYNFPLLYNNFLLVLRGNVVSCLDSKLLLIGV